MPGPRQDKKRAWDRLEQQLGRYCEGYDLGFTPKDKADVESRKDDVRHAVAILKSSGRLDAIQVIYIKKLVEAVWRLKWLDQIEG